MRLALKGLLGSPDQRRRGLRGLLGGVLLVLAVLLLTLLLLAVLLASEGFNRWFFQRVQAQVPALQIQFEQGSLWRGWRFQQLRWQTDTLTVGLHAVALDWTPACLLQRTLCLDRLYSERVVVQLGPEKSPPADEPIQLPDIQLPLSIKLSEARVDELYILQQAVDAEATPLLKDVRLVASSSGRGSRIHIEQFSGSLAGDDAAPVDRAIQTPGWLASGEIQLQANWPLQLQSQVQLPRLDGQAWALQLRAQGSLQQLTVQLASEGYLDGQLQAEIEPLDKVVPIQLQWHGEPFLPWSTLPPNLTLSEWSLQLAGDLRQGYQLQGRSQFQQLSEPDEVVNLALSGRLSDRAAEQVLLQFSVAGEPQRQLTLNGDLYWQSQIRANSRLQMQDFPWQWLYPATTGPMVIEQLEVDATLEDQRWQAQLNSKLLAPGAVTNSTSAMAVPSRWTLAAQVHGDEKGLQTDVLSFTQGQIPTKVGAPAKDLSPATVNGDLQLQWVPYPQWQAQLAIEQLDPSVWVKQLPGQLSGLVTSRGQLQQQALQLAASWNLEGHLRDLSTQLQGTLEHDNGVWQMPELLLEQGDNRIHGKDLSLSQVDSQVSGQVQLSLPELKSLWPGLRGEVNGDLTFTGRAGAPQLQAQLHSQQLGYGDWSLQRLSLDGDLSADTHEPGEANLQIGQLQFGDMDFGQLQLTLSGTQIQHQVNLALSDGQLEVKAVLLGDSDARGWQGKLSQGRVKFNLPGKGSLEWRQQQIAGLNYGRDSGRLTLSAHCWQQNDSRLCFTQSQQLLPAQQLQMQLQDFDFATLTPLLPDGLEWQGLLNGQLQLQQPQAGELSAELTLRSDHGELQRHQAAETVSLPYRNIALTLQMREAEALAQVRIDSELIGLLDIEALIKDPGGQQTLSGHYQLSQFNLQVLQAFLPEVSRLEGQLQGAGNLSGELRNPIIQGNLQLRDGHLSGPRLPVSLDSFSADIQVLGQQAQLQGQWRSGTEGQGRLDGELSWLPWQGQLRFYGEALPLSVPPYAELSVSPDLTATLVNQQLELGGRVSIPEGKIEVRELPPSVVHVSPDAVIVGQETEQSLPLALKARIQLEIGDQLYLSAFGLSGRLKGQVVVQENMTANGDVRILDGRFKRYGQDLRLRRSLLLFSGPISQPYLNVEAYRKVDDVVAGLRLSGRASNPASEIFSEPAMSQQEALSYLVLGRPLDEAETSEGERNMMGEAALAMGVAGGAVFAGRLGEAFGISDFELDTEGSGTDTQVVVSGNLTDKLSVRYGMGVFEPANQVALRYDLTRRLYIEAISGLANSLDFFYRIDF